VDRLARELAARCPDLAAWALREGARSALREARNRRQPCGKRELVVRAQRLARDLAAPSPRRVVNATGVVLHTNLGRAVLSAGAARAVADAACGYSDLELDLGSGRRGNRLEVVGTLLCRLSAAEAAHVVNNNAAALLLALDSLARDGEVVVSRGELVEIGGSFRVPEIVGRAGVRLVEVGTTNRTHPRDYEEAIGPQTAALLKVHRSNFEQRGFVAEVDLPTLVEIGRRRGIPVVEDLGSGTLVDLRPRGLPQESYVPARLAQGVDLLCFSGDKLLGGPQAGILLGRAPLLDRCRRNPLARALRLDKLTLAGLDWTLRALLEGRELEIPTLRQLLEPGEAVAERARALAKRLAAVAPAELRLDVVAARAPVGGGALPGFTLESFAVALAGRSADALAAALRQASVPVLGRVVEGRLLLDARTLLPGDEHALLAAVGSLADARGDDGV